MTSATSGARVGTTLEALTEEFLAGRADAAGEPGWLRDRRLEAFKTWVDQRWPQLRGEELWRDTPFTRFAVDVPIVTGDGELAAPVPSPLLDDVDLAGRVELRDGRVTVMGCSDAEALGVVITDLATAATTHEDLVGQHLGSLTADHDRTVTTNDAAWTAGVFVYIPPEVELAEPIGISIQAAQSGAHLPRLLVIADRHSRAELYVEHVSADLDTPTTVDEVAEVVVGDGAHLDLVTIQDWQGRVGHLVVHAAALHRDAQLRHLTVTIGGDTVRLRPEVHLVGAGSRIEPLGIYFSDEGQHFEHHPFIAHVAGHASSEVLYKGALQGRSRTVFRGHIFVHRDAIGSASNEVNKSLILSEGAKADSTPFLEIECAEVTAGHGSATGQIDEEQLFYLESRGISAADALRLVVFGFFAEVLDRIALPAVQARTLQHIEAEVDRADLTAIARRGRGRGVAANERGAA
ncbi:MAG: Fe-S cluster assembly protein SufD [Actinobacteria bacterium]|nr:Fe-S cluster assembly protein SufD [Actinomycetota bacterium]